MKMFKNIGKRILNIVFSVFLIFTTSIITTYWMLFKSDEFIEYQNVIGKGAVEIINSLRKKYPIGSDIQENIDRIKTLI